MESLKSHHMRIILLLLGIFCVQIVSFAQKIEKNSYYSDINGNYLHFQDDRVAFRLATFGFIVIDN